MNHRAPTPDRDFLESTPDVQETRLLRAGRRWRRVLRLVFGAVALLLWTGFAEETSHEYQLTLDGVRQRDANLAAAVEHYAVRVLATATAVHRLVGSRVAAGDSAAELSDLLTDRLRANDVFDALALCFPDGRVLVAADGPSRLDTQACASVAEAVQPRAELQVLPSKDSAAGLQLPLALPIAGQDGQRIATALALVPVRTVLGIMQSAVLREDTAVLLSGGGSALAAWRSQAGHVDAPAGFAPLAALLQVRNGEAAVGGQTYLVSWRPVPQAGLEIRVATSADGALADYRSRRVRFIIACLLASAGLALMYRRLSRMHTHSLSRAVALSRARASLQVLNAGLDQQVRERTAALEQANQDLETFSYAVAHDVRAPLGRIIGFADAMQSVVSAAGDPKQGHYLDRIRANAVQMEELTAALLALGRLTRAPLQRTDVDLAALAHEIVERLREAEPARSVDFAAEPGLVARGDRALLVQVLENLLGNAWKFTSRRATARIRLARAGTKAAAGEDVFVVADDGVGFDSELAAGLFQPFRRAHDASDFPGTGVGLAAVQRIVALHGGRVWCESERGAGAAFYFSLPRES